MVQLQGKAESRIGAVFRAVIGIQAEASKHSLVIVQREECTAQSRAVARVLLLRVHFCVRLGASSATNSDDECERAIAARIIERAQTMQIG